MNRRRFLTASTTIGATALTAGCTSSSSSSDTTTSSATTTAEPTTTASTTTAEPTPTETTTQAARQPELLSTSLLSRWDDFGDVETNTVDAVGTGAIALLGYRYRVMVHDGTLDITNQMRVFDPDGTRVALDDFNDEQLTDGDGMQTWENVFTFDTSDWDLGTYTTEVLVRDNVSGEVSETLEGEFEVNDPLGPDDVELTDVDAPDTVTVGGPYSFTLTFENVSTQDGSLVSTASAKYGSQSSWSSISGGRISSTMAAGSTNTWESGDITFDYDGVVQYRVDSIDAVWSVEVTQ